MIYSIKGPGVDEEPLGIFSIDKFSGKVFLNATLDREQNDRFRVRPLHGHVSPPPRAAPPSPPLPTPSLCPPDPIPLSPSPHSSVPIPLSPWPHPSVPVPLSP